ncbi:hypothetical protein M513_07796 [Trichuris suis]|uniref:Uncharacterized protein n=1 Tax=Trichuris suis TaxID=68888 RepID=A0A085M2E5_9BILA|nr:hypothetical protein M513_07796 [Trichuris suis]
MKTWIATVYCGVMRRYSNKSEVQTGSIARTTWARARCAYIAFHGLYPSRSHGRQALEPSLNPLTEKQAIGPVLILILAVFVPDR